MYVNSIDIDVDTRCTILQYLRFISKRASGMGNPRSHPFIIYPCIYPGELPTTATWIRQFVHAHPDYKHDSVVSDKITYDLITKVRAVSEGQCPCNDLIGKIASRTDSQRPTLPRRVSVRSENEGADDSKREIPK